MWLKETLAKPCEAFWSSAVRILLQVSTGAAAPSQGFTAPPSDIPAVKMVMIVVTRCGGKFVNFHLCEVKPFFQLRSEEGLGTELTAALKCHLFNLLDDMQHSLQFQNILVILNPYQFPPSK